MRPTSLIDNGFSRPAAGSFAAETVIFGLGQTGLSCVRHLARRGCTSTVIDSREYPPALDQLRRDFPAVPVRLGPVGDDALRGAGQIIVSPGVRLDHPALLTARERGVEIVGDIELFARSAVAPVIAITGSNGKSTVSTMVGEMFESAGVDVRLGGNIGTPALDLLSDIEPDCYILELSSFQLESTNSLAAEVACILNISPDHLDRHGSLQAYVTAKARILKRARHVVLNADDSLIRELDVQCEAGYFTSAEPAGNQYGLRSDRHGIWLAQGRESLLRATELGVSVTHDLLNALAAMAICDFMEIQRADQMRAMRNFAGLPHRCRQIAEKNGVAWYDDSKGTNTGATCAAVQGIFSQRSGVLIAGGQGKGADFSVLADALGGKVHTAVLIGEDAQLIAAAVGRVVAVEFATTMMDAVSKAANAAQSGDAVLLSPACASYDMFENFEARGKAFIACVEQLYRS